MAGGKFATITRYPPVRSGGIRWPSRRAVSAEHWREIFTEQANASYHHGLLERKPPLSTNPLSHWLDAGNSALGFQGRLKYRPVEQYPLRPYEVKQALEQLEKNLLLAFELDSGNYTAYDVYFYFLTNEVTQTEFASLAGAQLKDEDETPDQVGSRYNRVMLLAPDPTERQKSAEARRKFAEVGPLTLSEMTYYIEGAKTCQHDLEAKGLWQVIPERRAEFLRVLQLI